MTMVLSDRKEALPLVTALYIVATPIGNLSDITLRAVDILHQVGVIAAEDTRHSSILLKQYGVRARLLAVHEHNECESIEKIVQLLKQGQSVAYISDAGTPGVSDPGTRLVQGVRAAGWAVIPVPGVSALATAISVSGIVNLNELLFAGFLPAKTQARCTWLRRWMSAPLGLCFYEAPHRLRETLQDVVDILEGEREITVARELTKRFEQVVNMRLSEVLAWCDQSADHVRGEFVIIIGPPREALLSGDYAMLGRLLDHLVPLLPSATVARVVSDVTGIVRDEVYQAILQRKRDSED